MSTIHKDIANLIEETETTNKKESFISKHKGKIAAAGGTSAAIGAAGLAAKAYQKRKEDEKFVSNSKLAAGLTAGAGLAGAAYKYRKGIKNAVIQPMIDGMHDGISAAKHNINIKKFKK